MSNNIIESTLSNVCLHEKGSIISGPFGSNISSKFFVDYGVPVIRGNNLNTGLDNFNDYGFVFITEEKADDLKCSALRGDVIFTAAGTIGQVGYIPYDSKYTRYTISNKQIRARLDTTKIDLLYAYYWLSSPWIFKVLNSNNKGSTVPLLTLSEVKNLPIHYPQDLNKQKMIGQLLDKITQKITNNKKIISTLESLAKTIYDYWFLQFEFPNEEGKPYKSSGGKMVWNEELKREIPEEWEVRELSKIIKENDKSVIQTKQVDNVGVNPFFTSGEAVLLTDSYLVTGFNCYLSTGGNANVKLYDGKASYSTDTWCITSNDNYKYLLGLYLKTIEDYMDVKFFAGTGLKHLQKSLLKKELISIPSENILFAFNQITQEIYRLITKRKLENQQLTSLRDWLLPMLMNGQVTFKEDVHE